MRKLAKPADAPSDVYLACISAVRDPNLKKRLASVAGNVVSAASEFASAASLATLHMLPPQSNVGGVVSKEEMADVYVLRMAKKGTPGRPVYDKLMAAPAYGRCPLCGQRTVSTLDHHLAKAHYPALSVVPTNLVPACADCNKAKIDVIPGAAEEQTLHPYFDDVEDDRWLHAEVVQTSPAAVRFFVDSPPGWSALRTARVRHHFMVFKLAALYASHSAEELVNIRYSLDKLFARTGVAGVKAHLRDKAESCMDAHVNSWQTAMYTALVEDEWFCDGGFQL
jgi:hypothetical protein